MPGGAAEATIIIAGSGELPAEILKSLRKAGSDVRALTLPGFDGGPVWDGILCQAVTLENFQSHLANCRNEGFWQIVFAGSVHRPQLSEAEYRRATASGDSIEAKLLGSDDQALRSIIAMVEAIGFTVRAAHEIVPELIATPGVLTRKHPSHEDRLDVARAAAIVRALGKADVGQSAIVAGRQCIAVETIAGTDNMLESAGSLLLQFNPMPDQARGVMYKAPKPDQDMRVDMPAIGRRTVELAAAAGLGGISVEAGAVLIFGKSETIAAADRFGLFIWARPPDG
ncbi:MAG: UDP-2,3-diacylglucosamine diphosphatase LpxI [Rhodobacteraceae bacterium]|nr:UDP-2,3-diacylglucosamine diphosphatase LpxI [Paracoccaceae bacterium]